MIVFEHLVLFDHFGRIARPLFGKEGEIDYFVAVFFTSYMLLAGIVLLNVWNPLNTSYGSIPT